MDAGERDLSAVSRGETKYHVGALGRELLGARSPRTWGVKVRLAPLSWLYSVFGQLEVVAHAATENDGQWGEVHRAHRHVAEPKPESGPRGEERNESVRTGLLVSDEWAQLGFVGAECALMVAVGAHELAGQQISLGNCQAGAFAAEQRDAPCRVAD